MMVGQCYCGSRRGSGGGSVLRAIAFLHLCHLLGVLPAHLGHQPRKRHAARQIMIQRPPPKFRLVLLAQLFSRVASSASSSTAQAAHKLVHPPLPLRQTLRGLGVHPRQRKVGVGHLAMEPPQSIETQAQRQLVVVDARQYVGVGALEVAEAGVDLGQVEEEVGLLFGGVFSGGGGGGVIVVVVALESCVFFALESNGRNGTVGGRRQIVERRDETGNDVPCEIQVLPGDLQIFRGIGGRHHFFVSVVVIGWGIVLHHHFFPILFFVFVSNFHIHRCVCATITSALHGPIGHHDIALLHAVQ
mmetsp:Transcript_22911/g.48291  ORF Transcript_22911/g.48291 Transcript_22911/m.48291 type:complete len:302 (+) Transcript_22911:579-1484(+)